MNRLTTLLIPVLIATCLAGCSGDGARPSTSNQQPFTAREVQQKVGTQTFSRSPQYEIADFGRAVTAGKNLGFGLMRFDVSFGDIVKWNQATQSFTLSSQDIQHATALAGEVINKGMTPVMVFPTVHDSMPDTIFGQPDKQWGWPTTAKTRQAYSQYVSAVVRNINGRFPGVRLIVQVGNEPTSNQEFDRYKVHYADLVREAVQTTRNEGGKATFLSAGVGTHDLEIPPTWINPARFFDFLTSQGLHQVLDGYAIHSYNPSHRRPKFENNSYYAPEGMIDEISNLINKTPLPVYITETGYSSLSYVDPAATEANQTNYQIRSVLSGLAMGAEIVILYELVDRTASQFQNAYSDNRERAFGLLDGGLQPKPSAEPVREFFRELTGYQVDGPLRKTADIRWGNEYFLYELRFRNAAGARKTVTWTDRPFEGDSQFQPLFRPRPTIRSL
ncbi:MAG: hypothetical protein MUC92_07475 [Fimbriimonadaceae bacterium]|nr:hypothetical protein [Fimbriimonadaceae bacterium]